MPACWQTGLIQIPYFEIKGLECWNDGTECTPLYLICKCENVPWAVKKCLTIEGGITYPARACWYRLRTCLPDIPTRAKIVKVGYRYQLFTCFGNPTIINGLL